MAKKYSQICLSKPAFRGGKLRILQQITQQVGNYKSNFFLSNYVTKKVMGALGTFKDAKELRRGVQGAIKKLSACVHNSIHIDS